jgi:hypothetical protein
VLHGTPLLFPGVDDEGPRSAIVTKRNKKIRKVSEKINFSRDFIRNIA